MNTKQLFIAKFNETTNIQIGDLNFNVNSGDFVEFSSTSVKVNGQTGITVYLYDFNNEEEKKEEISQNNSEDNIPPNLDLFLEIESDDEYLSAPYDPYDNESYDEDDDLDIVIPEAKFEENDVCFSWISNPDDPTEEIMTFSNLEDEINAQVVEEEVDPIIISLEEKEEEKWSELVEETVDEEEKTDDSEPPKEFICCISTDLMIEPVFYDCGHYFDKENIDKWCDINTACPMCRRELVNQRVDSDLTEHIQMWVAERANNEYSKMYIESLKNKQPAYPVVHEHPDPRINYLRHIEIVPREYLCSLTEDIMIQPIMCAYEGGLFDKSTIDFHREHCRGDALCPCCKQRNVRYEPLYSLADEIKTFVLERFNKKASDYFFNRLRRAEHLDRIKHNHY